MLMSDPTCFNQFFVNPTATYSNWSDELSVSSEGYPVQQIFPVEGGLPKDPVMLEDLTTSNSGRLISNTATGARAQSPTYSLAEDVLIYNTVSKAKNKLSAKKMVAQKLGRSYSGILNRYHILKSLSAVEIQAILDKHARNEAAPDTIFVNIKRTPVGNTRKNTWKLVNFIENGVRGPELELKQVPSSPVKTSGSSGHAESTDQSLQPQRKNSERKGSKKIVRGPYNTQNKKALEQIRGQGSPSISNFLEELLTSGLKAGLFLPEEICENVYQKYRHPSRLIEKVLECARENPGSNA